MSTILSGASVGIITLPLGGTNFATCPNCAGRLAQQILALVGVVDARVDASAGTIAIQVDDRVISREAVRTEAQKIEQRLQTSFLHRVYRIEGLDCAHCAEGIETAVRQITSVSAAHVQFSAAKLVVEFDAALADQGGMQVEKRVRGLGFALTDTEPKAGTDTSAAATPSWLASRPAQVAVCGVFLALGLAAGQLAPGDTLERILLGGAVLSGGYRLAAAGLQALRSRVLGTNLLMVIAAAGAIALGHWSEAATVVFLYTLGEVLEGAAMQRARTSLRALIDAAPEHALIQKQNELQPTTVLLGEVRVGDVLVVRPGAKVPTDGVVISGVSSVAEAAITGEAMPREKRRGDAVYGGSVNGNGSLLVRVTAAAADSTVARVQHLVEEAQAQKAPLQTEVERFGRIYTPLVLVVAVLIAMLGPVLLPGANWTYRALTLLVVSCPCALIIATPVAFVCGIARGAREGVLIKGGIHLESLAQVRAVAMDKTGTLTAGTVRVTEIVPVGAIDPQHLLALAASVERESEHPVAAAIAAEAARQGALPEPMQNIEAIPGRGVQAVHTATDRVVRIGSAAFLAGTGIVIPAPLGERAAQAEAYGKTVALVAADTEVLGLLTLSDELRPEAASVVRSLQEERDLRTAMLTGDNRGAAQFVAAQVGITEVQAQLLPEDKLAAIRTLDTGGGVAFVGDGINDAPALAAARVGIGMGRGTAAALETADVVLMRGNLTALPFAMRLARATRTIVRVNLALSVAAVLVLVLGSVLGGISLPVGVLAHEASALLVTINALCLLSPLAVRNTAIN